MTFLSRLLQPKAPPLSALWETIAALARNPEWYRVHDVPDTLDGRFDMVALVTALVMIRMEAEGLQRETVLLTERFVDDMESSLREIGVGDMVVGKHVGNMVGALGGRIGGYREALAAPEPEGAMAAALMRNIWRKEQGPSAAACRLARVVLRLSDRIRATPAPDLLAGKIAW
ncbi:ubiquinol-cytochrome C chaperone family protein [Thermaurantiacus sp.]